MTENRETTSPPGVDPKAKREGASASSRRQYPEDIVFFWWSELTEQPKSGQDGGEKRPNRRGERAELRRCSSLGEVAFCHAYLRLRSKLTAAGLISAHFRLDWLAALAGVLAHVKENAPLPHHSSNLGTQLGAPKGDKAIVSDARFRRLLVVDGPAELFRQMTRVVAILNGKIDIRRLSHDVLSLSDDREDRVRQEWAFAYYEASPEKKK